MAGCLKSIRKFVIFILVIFLMGVLSVVNLVYTNALGETCGIVHPYIFQIDVSSIDVQTGTKANAYENTIPTSGANQSFDTYLRIYDEDGTLVDSNDDFGEALTSRIENFAIGRYGTVIIEVATYADEGSGQYELTLKTVESSDTDEGFSITIDGETFSSTQVIQGELAEGERIEYQVSAEQPVTLVVYGIFDNEYQLDSYIRVYDEAGNLIAENDDFSDEYVAAAIEALPLDDYGTVTVEVATYDDSYLGVYNFVVAMPEEGVEPQFDWAAFEIGETEVAVNTRDEVLDGISVIDEIEVGERVRYTISSNDVDASFVEIRLDGAGAITNFESEYLFQSDNPSAPLQWTSCVDHYGYVDGTSFTLNQRGLQRFGQGTFCNPNEEGCTIVSHVSLNFFGQMIFYLILPGLVILLPFIAIFAIRDEGGSLVWIMMLMFVATHVLTSSLLYVHLATASGIEALANFAYGILAGAATGSAIAFMDKVLDKFKDEHKEAQERAATENPSSE